MKIDREKYLKELRRVESEIKALKAEMHKPDYQISFDFSKLEMLKAEATRLYTLRTLPREGKHSAAVNPGESARFLYKNSVGRVTTGPLRPAYIYYYSADKRIYKLLQEHKYEELILNGVEGWRDQFLVHEPEKVILQPSGVELYKF